MFKNTVLFIFLLALAWLSACNNSDPQPELTLNLESEHYNYYFSESDEFEVDLDWMEAHYDWVVTTLAVNPARKLDYYKYIDRAHLSAITGQNTNGFAEVGTWKFHSIWHPENHENVHTIIINTIGHPPALFNEGIAVAMAPQPIYGRGVFNETPTWNGQNLDEIASRLKANNQIPALNDLLESVSFFRYDTGNTYPMAGSFVRYIMDQYSIANLKSFFSSVTFESTATEVTSEFFTAFNISLESVWASWIDSL